MSAHFISCIPKDAARFEIDVEYSSVIEDSDTTALQTNEQCKSLIRARREVLNMSAHIDSCVGKDLTAVECDCA